MAQVKHKYELPKLQYTLDALEPVISQTIMDLHYNKHHNAYVTNLNNALEQMEEADLTKQIQLQSAIKFNGGGHLNHTLFWENLAPKDAGGGTPPSGNLAKAIESEFGSLNNFITQFNQTTGPIQGSGWGWLGYNKSKKRLEIATCSNQDPLESTTGLIPLLGVDVWEHAYYIDYKNARPEYLKKIWDVINWKCVEERFNRASQ